MVRYCSQLQTVLHPPPLLSPPQLGLPHVASKESEGFVPFLNDANDAAFELLLHSHLKLILAPEELLQGAESQQGYSSAPTDHPDPGRMTAAA